MQQNQRGRNNRRRNAYDQARDPARRTAAQPGRNRNSTPGTGRSGHPITNPNYDPDAPRPSRYTERQVNMGGDADNSIQFPAGGRVQTGTRPRQAADAQRRPQGRSAARRPAGGPNRRSSPPPRNGRAQSGQRLRPTQANLRDPARREGRKKRRLTRAAIRRRRMFRRLTALAMLAAVIAAGVYLTVTMLFKINTIRVCAADGAVVQEAGGYTGEQILQALGVQPEENIFSFDPAAKAAALEKVFPLLEEIRVERDYPSTVVVRVTEARPAYAMQTRAGWLTLSAGLKILASDSVQPAGLPTLYGGEPLSSTPGDRLAFAAEQAAGSASADSAESAADSTADTADRRLEALNTLMAALDSAGMQADVTRIEFADPEQTAFLYQDRISILLGTLNELDYKLKLAKHVLLNEDGKGCAATDTGVLDFTHISMSSTRKFTFAQGTPALPSGYVVPQAPAEAADDAAEEPTPAEGNGTADPAAEEPAVPADPAADPAPEADGTQTQN
mgnify:CR=1 FL=1